MKEESSGEEKQVKVEISKIGERRRGRRVKRRSWKEKKEEEDGNERKRKGKEDCKLDHYTMQQIERMQEEEL